MAKAPAKAGKKKSFKKKEKRVVHSGVVHIQATFNNTIVTITRSGRQYALLVERRFAGLPRIAQGHSLRRAAGGPDGGQQGQRKRAARGGSARVSGPGSGRESAVRALTTAGIEVRAIKDRDADPAQRLPSAEEAQSVSVEQAIGAATVRQAVVSRTKACHGRKLHLSQKR